ncbi:insensible isoform X2 [Rhynchophorus ferrugineus]|uniref:insensible isoform X2 n=1 Tax=Rhynchophorus ferrugineus TaxID=354439 RepID=UPI003FCD2720
MKREGLANKSGKYSNRRIIRHRGRDGDRMTETLKYCLQKICELQAEIQQDEEEIHDPEAEGYSVCAMETLSFRPARYQSL